MRRPMASLSAATALLSIAVACGDGEEGGGGGAAVAGSGGSGAEAGSAGGGQAGSAGASAGSGPVDASAGSAGEIDAGAPDAPFDAGSAADHGGDSCPSLSCLECSGGTTGCASEGPFVAGTCCAIGDNLLHVGAGAGSEVVDLESNGKYAVLCGGFGARINDVSDPNNPKPLGVAGPRCQRIAFGETLGDGTQVLYLAHHGDSWVPPPSLSTYHVLPDGTVELKSSIEDPAILFEGLHYRSGHLYVAVHSAGLRVYTTDADGIPTFVNGIGGFANAWKLDSDADHLYVADADAGLRVLSLADPVTPSLVQTYATVGGPRDVDVADGRVYVAMGAAGVDVFDVTAPGQLSHVDTVADEGSAQAVSVDSGLLAVANWSHVALRDATTLRLIGTEKTRSRFEQDLGVALLGRHVYVGEWEGLHVLEYREGFIAADIHFEEDIFTLSDEGPTARSVIVKNRGLVDLDVRSIDIDDASFTLDVSQLTIEPGKADFFQFTVQSPATGTNALLTLETNDPDQWQSTLQRSILVDYDFGLGVGDALSDSFAFLDPSGANQLSGLQGKVVVLAYFALF